MKNNIFKKIIIFLIIVSFLVVGGVSLFAQTTPEQERASLESQLKALEARIAEYERDVTKTQAERQALQHEVNTLRTRISQLNNQIRQAQATAQILTGQIKDKEVSITVTISEIEGLRNRISNNLMTIYKEDQKSFLEVLVSGDNLSGFFDNLLSLKNLSKENRDLLGQIINLKINLEEEKSHLSDNRDEAEVIAQLRAAQAQEIDVIRRAQERLLTDVQKVEAAKKQELDSLRAQAAQIRARIFELAGTPTSQAPTFGEAYEIAKWVEGITGVRPAFLLAVLQQESAIGRNVGQCYLPRDPQENQARRVMAAPPGSSRDDVSNFLTITRELGLDPYRTPISCPMSFGFGGAMGPAQFIPTTWMAYRPRLAVILGRPASPWNIRDAFLASGLYLSDYGARAKTREAEWCAAQGYFTGIRCNSNHAFYGNNVLAIADRFQADINILNQSR